MGTMSDLYRGRTDFNFPRVYARTTIVSLVLVVASVGFLFTRGLNLSIDFEGGSVWEVPAANFTQAQAEKVLTDAKVPSGEKFQEATTLDGQRILRITGRVDSVQTGTEVADKLSEAAGLKKGAVTVNTVGPSWGEDITRQARTSLIVFMVLVALYITWRLEARMAAAALIAVVHDVLITVGVYSVFQIQVTPATVISFLTILGFSLYDTIVVYDRVQENGERLGRTGQYTYTAIMRRSLNQVMMRSVNTTFIAILPILSMLVVGRFLFGQQTLADFSLALLIGLISGTYSSIFVAAPLTVWFKEREARWTEIRKRLVAKGVDVKDTAWHGVSSGSVGRRSATAKVATAGAGGAVVGATATTTGDGDGEEATGAAAKAPAPLTPGGHPPRPRKKRR